MKTVVACLCILGLAMVGNGQEAGAPSDQPAARMLISSMEVGRAPVKVLPGGGRQTGNRTVAKNVEIQSGSTVVTADEAEIRFGAPGQPDELDLHGNVRMRTKVKVDYRE